MSDERLRELQRLGRVDPVARFRFFSELDRHVAPHSPPLTTFGQELVQRFKSRLHEVLRSVNGASKNARVEVSDVATSLAHLDDLPEVDGVRWVRLLGPPPFGQRNKRTVVLIVAEAMFVAIGAVAERPTSGFYVGPEALPEVLAAWARRERLRVPREVAERWARPWSGVDAVEARPGDSAHECRDRESSRLLCRRTRGRCRRTRRTGSRARRAERRLRNQEKRTPIVLARRLGE